MKPRDKIEIYAVYVSLDGVVITWNYFMSNLRGRS